MPLTNYRRHLACSLLVLLAACSDKVDKPAPAAPPAAQQPAVPATPALEYTTVVQQLYISYFGRPADVAGLTSFRDQLAAIGAPTDLQKLDQVYNDDPGVKTLIDSFGMSTESQSLHTGDNSAFIISVFQNVLGRQPTPEGLAFWVGALNDNSLSRGKASLSIMAGALANTTEQGVKDAALVQKKVAASSEFTRALIDTGAAGYSGKPAAEKARKMLADITESTGSDALQASAKTLAGSMGASSGNGAAAAAAPAIPASPATAPAATQPAK